MNRALGLESQRKRSIVFLKEFFLTEVKILT